MNKAIIMPPESSQISHALARIAPSATMGMTQKARDYRAAGLDVIGLAAGEPDFDTPDHIKEAAIKAIERGETNYTAVDGMPALKEAICEKFKRDNNLDYSPAQINVSPGGKPVLYNAFMATLNPGDEVIIPTPSWVSYPEMVKLCGGTAVMAAAEMAQGFKLTPESLERAITARTKWLILNSPSNPTGAAYSRAELRALGEVLIQHPQVLILTDDIYEHIVYDGFEYATLASVVPALYDRVLTMNGVSKAYAMTGWRIGFAGGPQWLIQAMAKVMTQSTSNPSSISQWAAMAALQGPHDFLASWVTAYQARRNLIVARLNAISGLSCLVPEGAFYVFPDCSELLGRKTVSGIVLKTDVDVCNALLDEAHLALVPGSAFHCAPNLRLSYACDIDTLGQAAARLEQFCNSLSEA